MKQTPDYWNGCFAIAVILLLASAAGAQQDKAAIDKLYNAAKKEGRVVIWGPTDAIVYETHAGIARQTVSGYQDRVTSRAFPNRWCSASSPKARRASRRPSISSSPVRCARCGR